MGAEPVPRREVVTARPRTGPGGRTQRPLPRPAVAPGPRPAAVHAEPAGLARLLMRRQLRAALTATALLAVPLGLLPVVLRLLPAAGTGPDTPLAVWLLLGVVPYPALLGAGTWYVRRAERNERDVTAR